MTEEWRNVVGYERSYQVSNLGNIRSLDRVCGIKPVQGQIIKPRTEHGYERVTLYENNKPKKFFVHRLVAAAFIENPNCLPFINHKDENPKNNAVDNLEWCTQKYNIHYGSRMSKVSEKNRGENHYSCRLTVDKVAFVREHYIPRDKEFGASAIARQFGVSVGAIRAIIVGRSWKHLMKEEKS